jgi:GntP family permease
VSGDAWLLVYAAIDVVALILLIARWKLHPFIALVGASLALGLAVGMKPLDVAGAFQTGVGDVLGCRDCVRYAAREQHLIEAALGAARTCRRSY